MTLIWTRAAADWPDDAPLLLTTFAPQDVLRLPCLRVTARTPDAASFACDYLIFTSPHAVRFALQVPEILAAAHAARGIFTHGASTGEALSAAGFHPHVIASARTAAELCAWLATNLRTPAHFGLPSSEDPAFPLAAALTARGFTASTWVCYATTAAATDPEGRALSLAEVAQGTSDWTGAICFASPSAVLGFCTSFAPATTRLRRALTAVVIGPTTQAAAQPHFQRVVMASHNSLIALIAAAATV